MSCLPLFSVFKMICSIFGADLATPIVPDLPYEPLRMTDAQVTWLEEQIDRLNDRLEPLSSFILPGGYDWRATFICRVQ